jgi:hypothetical protein
MATGEDCAIAFRFLLFPKENYYFWSCCSTRCCDDDLTWSISVRNLNPFDCYAKKKGRFALGLPSSNVLAVSRLLVIYSFTSLCGFWCPIRMWLSDSANLSDTPNTTRNTTLVRNVWLSKNAMTRPIRQVFRTRRTPLGIRHRCGMSGSAKRLGRGCPDNSDKKYSAMFHLLIMTAHSSTIRLVHHIPYIRRSFADFTFFFVIVLVLLWYEIVSHMQLASVSISSCAF